MANSRTTIERFLAEVRAALGRRAALRSSLYAAAAAMAVSTIAAFWASAAGPAMGRASFVLFAAGVLVSTAAAVIFGWLRPRRRWRDDARVARYVGEQLPELQSDLLSAVELGRGESRHSPALLSALEASTAARLEHHRPQALVPLDLRRPMAASGGVAGLLFLGLVITDLPRGFAHLWTSPPPQAFGGAIRSSQPLVTDLELEIIAPSYAGRPTQTLDQSSGDIRALAGSRIEMRGRAQGADEVFVVWDDSEDNRISAGSARVEVAFEVLQPRSYRFLVEGVDGETRVEDRARKIEIEPDRPPTIDLIAPADELDVADLQRIELAYMAEDDFGLSKIELVWSDGTATEPGEQPEEHRVLSESGEPRAQDKLLWDLTEIDLSPGVRIAYRIDAWDNDTVSGPKRTSSKTYYLRVYSPREKHEELIADQERLFEAMVELLAARLTVAAEDLEAHRPLLARTRAIATQIGTLVAALESDELAHDKLKSELLAVRERFDDSAAAQQKAIAALDEKLARGGDVSREIASRLGAVDAQSVPQLESDVLLLADWIDRQKLENLLAVGDEIQAHQEQLQKLMEEYKRTGSAEVREELMREIRKLRRRIAELEAKQSSMPNDVLDQFVNADAIKLRESKDCLEEVSEHLERGEVELADKALERCIQESRSAKIQMEQALSDMRGERFSESQKNLDEVRSRLADLTKDQETISKRSGEIWDRYAEQVDEEMKEKARETRARLGQTIRKLKRQLDNVPENALTEFSREEKDVVERRVEDLERMLARGDIAEAQSQAREAQQGLSTMKAETEEAADAAPRYSRHKEDTIRAIGMAERTARKLAEELSKATPSPREVMSRADRNELRRLSRMQNSVKKRADALKKRIEKLTGELPGQVSEEAKRTIEGAGPHMRRASNHMRQGDPSGARLESRDALRSLEGLQKRLRRIARGSGARKQSDEPVRIPGAEEYRAPEAFREDILDAMKSHEAPTGYQDLVKRYYEELIR